MTENEAIKEIKCWLNFCFGIRIAPELVQATGMATEALREVQQYRAIGTVEECRAAVKKQTAMEPIRMGKCTCPSCGTHNEVWKKRRNTLPRDIVYCWHCGQAVEIKRSDK